MVSIRPPPVLDEPDKWSPELNDFIRQCLIKGMFLSLPSTAVNCTNAPECLLDFKERPRAVDLLLHPFIQQAYSMNPEVVLKDIIHEMNRIKEKKRKKKEKDAKTNSMSSSSSGSSSTSSVTHSATSSTLDSHSSCLVGTEEFKDLASSDTILVRKDVNSCDKAEEEEEETEQLGFGDTMVVNPEEQANGQFKILLGRESFAGIGSSKVSIEKAKQEEAQEVNAEATVTDEQKAKKKRKKKAKSVAKVAKDDLGKQKKSKKKRKHKRKKVQQEAEADELHAGATIDEEAINSLLAEESLELEKRLAQIESIISSMKGVCSVRKRKIELRMENMRDELLAQKRSMPKPLLAIAALASVNDGAKRATTGAIGLPSSYPSLDMSIYTPLTSSVSYSGPFPPLPHYYHHHHPNSAEQQQLCTFGTSSISSPSPSSSSSSTPSSSLEEARPRTRKRQRRDDDDDEVDKEESHQ